MMYTGKEALDLIGPILASVDKNGRYPLHEGDCGYYRNANGIYTAWDNTTGDCWVEDFKTKQAAIKWLDYDAVSGS